MQSIATRALLVMALAAPMAGCIVTTEDRAPDAGTLTVAYTIAGSTDPGLCADYDISDIELIVSDPSGATVLTAYQPCEDFYISTDLYPGLYNADVTLVDRANVARSFSKPLQAVRVVEDAEVVVDVDFPSGSLL